MPGFVPWKKVNPSQKRADQKRRLEELLNKIFDHYFAALWPLTLQSSAAKDTLFSFFEKKIALLLNFSHTDGPGALLGVFYKSAKPNDRNFNKFDRCLRVIFLSEVPITAPYKSIDKNDLAQICCNAIVSALQEATFFTPACIYNGIERIPDAAITTLTNILKHVDQLVHRHRFSIAYPDMSRAQTRLYQEVARVDGFVSLPLLRLPTSALAATELAKFCVGRNTLSDRLARYIVKNDGVMLIAGYRGVGKSTFVNSVISKLPTFEKHQGSAGQWHLIPIQINVAKADSVINVLRLCVRAIYRTFFVDDPQKTHHDLEKLLDKKEKYLLKWANLCAIRKVDMKWSESISSLRSIEASLDLKPGDLLPKPISASPLKTLLPGFAAKANKEWNKRVEHSIALLDYDEDRAEEDLIRIIDVLSRPGTHRAYGIKLVFIFDEMDKLEDEEIKHLIKQLKNLFLTRYAVFILVTGKEFYYYWLKEQKHEDSLLSSYFSIVEMIPLFTSKDTVDLLKRLRMDISNTPLTSSEEAFIQTVARYLTYQAKGLPREIVRELQKIQQWIPESLQPYITNRSDQEDIFQVYADLQGVIEGIVSDTANNEWKEQIERGLYVLIEELFDLRSVSLQFDGVLKEIYQRNFSLVPVDEFKALIERLKLRLSTVLIKDTTVIERKSPLFSLDTQEHDTSLTVASAFYRLTGRVALLATDSQAKQKLTLSSEDIVDRLQQNNLFRWKEAFEALKQDQKMLPALSSQLYDIFIAQQGMHSFSPDQIGEFRHSAANYLKGRRDFFIHMQRLSPDRFIQQETNIALIQDFIQLIQQASTPEEKQHGAFLLLKLLERQTQLASKSNDSLQLTKALIIDLISALSILAEQDILDEVVRNLALLQDISDIFRTIQGLAKKFDRRLIDLLILYDFRAADKTLIQTLLYDMSRNKEQLHDIWFVALNHKQKELARQAMIIILQLYAEANSGQEEVLSWFNAQQWDNDIDSVILTTAINERNYSYFMSLEIRIDNKLAQNVLHTIIESKKPLPINVPLNVPSHAETQPLRNDRTGQDDTHEKRPMSRRRVWTVTLCMIGLILVYFIVPFDLPVGVSPWGWFIRRLLEAVFIYTVPLGTLWLGIGIFEKDGSWTAGGLFFATLGAGSLLLMIFLFPLVVTLWGQVALIFLLIAFWIPLLFLAEWS